MERRVRTFWLMRERYRVASRVAAALGGVAALGLVGATGWRDYSAGVPISREFAVQSALLMAAGILIPYVATRLLWRRYRRLHYEDLG